MGLTLLKEEMAQAMGYKSVQEMEAATGTSKRILADGNQTQQEKDRNERENAWFELAGEVQTNAQSSVDVLNDLLNYDKIETGTLMLELTVVRIWSLIKNTVGEFKLPMASKNIKLNFSFSNMESGDEEQGGSHKIKDLKVIGDTVRITQVIRNLISNAIKFTPEGGDITIDASWQPTKNSSHGRTFNLKKGERVSCNGHGELVLTVKDTGAGMTKAQLKKLFGKGVQFNVNELQHGNGSGLGLYIAMGIVEQHEGRLSCDSEGLGFGTTFTMKLPLYDIPKDVTNPAAEAANHDSFNEDESVAIDQVFEEAKLRILIVDDAVSNRKLLARLLQNKGHQTEQAEDGSFGVDMVRSAEDAGKPYDMVLLDYEMPVMNGPEAAKQIRMLGSDVFIVGVTGNLMPEDVAFFRGCGANAVLPKPFRMTELDNLIFEHHITGTTSWSDGGGSSQ